MRWLHRLGYLATAIVALQIGSVGWIVGKSYLRQRDIIISHANAARSIQTSPDKQKTADVLYFPSSFRKPTLICHLGPKSDPIAIASDLENEWYSRQLSAAQEPSLYHASSRPQTEGTTIRFTWLRSFQPAVFVRVEGLGTATPYVVAKQLTGAGGYNPGTIARQIDRRLTTEEAITFAAALNRTGVLRLPPKECDLGVDGAEWLIEGVDGQGYHFVNRWSPSHGEVREIGLSMLGLTGWQYKDP